MKASVYTTVFVLVITACFVGCRNESTPTSATTPVTPSDAKAVEQKQPTESVTSASEDASGEIGGAQTIATEPSQPAKSEVPSQDRPAVIAPVFETIGEANGLVFRREDDIRGQRRIFESTGGGAAVIDFDQDGLLDILFSGGCKLPLENDSPAATCGFFRNLGSLRFSDAATGSRLLQPGYCQGIAVGDYDADGFDDVYITAFGENGLWHNNGDGTFEDVTIRAGVDVPSWSTSCAFADLNLDGALDLYVVNYLVDSSHAPLQCPNPSSPDGFEQCPPSKYEGVDDVLFINDGAGRFLDVTAQAGLSGLKGKGLGLVITDFDGDARPEIYVANDGQANFLFRNTANAPGQLVYEELALLSGAALSRSGYAQASMGIAAGDYDASGTIDLIITNFYGDSNIVYKNLGHFAFEDATRSSGLAGPSRSVLGWGTALVDLNNDNRLDLFVANGHVEDREWKPNGDPYRMPPQVFINEGFGRFADASATSGTYFTQKWLGRGVATGDLDRDGRCDLVISHQLEPSTAQINRTPELAPAMSVRLIGTRSNRNAIGAKLELLTGNGSVLALRELTGGTSFLSSSSREVLLAREPSAVALRITWPSGEVQQVTIPEDREIYVIEGVANPRQSVAGDGGR